MWRIYSASPFVNCLMFSSTQNALTSLTVSGATTVTTNSAVTRKQYTVSTWTGASAFLNKGVKWSAVKTAGQTGQTGTVTVDQYGLATFSADCTGKWDIVATATGIANKSDSVTVTVSAS